MWNTVSTCRSFSSFVFLPLEQIKTRDWNQTWEKWKGCRSLFSIHWQTPSEALSGMRNISVPFNPTPCLSYILTFCLLLSPSMLQINKKNLNEKKRKFSQILLCFSHSLSCWHIDGYCTCTWCGEQRRGGKK